MSLIFLISFCLLAVIAYCIRIIVYASALPRSVAVTRLPADIARMSISLLVPVRNEHAQLERLVREISNLDYPDRLYDVIFIDDHSEDGSDKILRDAANGNSNYHFLQLSGDKEGKKQAISAGVHYSDRDWILQVDADAILPPGLLREHAARAAEGDVVLITGPVLQSAVSGGWKNIESLEFMSLAAAGMASFFTGKPIMCNGANLSYSRPFYLTVEEELLTIPSTSGDDVFMLQSAVNHDKSVAYLAIDQAVVETPATGSMKEFLRQRTRWASKTRYSADSELVLVAVLVWLANAVLTGLLVAGLVRPNWLALFMPLWVLKAGSDLYLLYRFTTLYQRNRILCWFLPASLFYYFYIVVAGLLAMAGRFRWKGRKYSAATD